MKNEKKLHRIIYSKISYTNILFLKSEYANKNIYYKNGSSVWTLCRQTITYCPTKLCQKEKCYHKIFIFLCISTAKHSSSIEKQATVFHMGKTRHSQVYILDILFRQIIMFIKVPVTFVFGLQTL